MKPFRFIGYPYATGTDIGGSELGPSYFVDHQHLEPIKDIVQYDQSEQPVISDDDRTTATRRACQQLIQRVGAVMKSGEERPFVLGGDHTCAMGTWPAVNARADSPGLLYIDAHLDAHTPDSSHTKNIHGMTLSELLTDDDWLELDHPGLPMGPGQVCLFGVRSYEPEERALLDRLGVSIFTEERISSQGLEESIEEALSIIDYQAGFGCSIDLDVFPPDRVPGVNTRTDGSSIDPDPLFEALRTVRGNIIALEIAEYNPRRDSADRTANVITRGLHTIGS